MNPYHEALKFIQEHPGTDSAAGMAKLILSLYNANHAFGIGECLWSFDGERLDLSVRMVRHAPPLIYKQKREIIRYVSLSTERRRRNPCRKPR